jgi:hypothetical protein
VAGYFKGKDELNIFKLPNPIQNRYYTASFEQQQHFHLSRTLNI